MREITTALDSHDLHNAIKYANEAINIKNSNPIIKGISV
jgi:hypothetical protein